MRFRRPAALRISGLVTLLAAGIPVYAAAPKGHVEVVTTDRADLPAGGSIRFEDSYGELNIEGWDQPGVEVVLTRWSYATEADRGTVTKKLDSIRIGVARQGNDLVIRTPLPPRLHSHVLLDYRVMAPRSARLVIRHGTGDVVIGGVNGAVDASVKTGDILLRLSPSGNYSFDTYCRVGQVLSDFAGDYRRRHLLAESYTQSGPAVATPVHLHVGIGGIDIRKLPL